MVAFICIAPNISTVSAQTTYVLSRVIVISLDGARPDAILQANTPNMHMLAERGTASWTAQTVYPSVTNIGHASMLTGLSVEQHGVNHNDSFVFPCPSLPIETPTFLTLAQQAGYSTAIVVGKERLCYFRQLEETDYTFAREGDRSVVDRVLELIDGGYQVIFAQFPNPDYFGHSTGWMSPVYLSEMSRTDAQIGRILTRLDELGLTDETLIIITADHGGHLSEHGSDMPEDMTIPFIIAGPGVQSGAVLGDVSVMDTAATVLWALGIDAPQGMTGRALLQAFAPIAVS